MRTEFPTLFLNWYQKHVRFVFCTCFGMVISEGPADTAKVPEEVPEDGRVLRERRLVFPTSNCLATWLIPSGTTRS